jgi:hypothetical protein
MHLTARQPHQVLKRGALAGQSHARVGPIELAQQRRRIENAFRRALRPLSFHQTDEEHFVELPVLGGLRVEQLHARMAGARSECLSFNPSPNHRGHARQLDRRVVQVLVRPAQTVNRGEHGAPRAQVTLAQRIADFGNAIVRIEKRQQRVELHRRALLLRQGAQLRRRGDRRPGGLPALERPQVLDTSEISFIAEGAIQRRHIASSKGGAIDFEREVRRPEQRHNGLAREVGRDELEHQIERRGIRLCRQRQRIERLVGNTRVGKHVAREIDIRQRALEHHRAPIEIGCACGLDAGGDRGELVFAVATHSEWLRVGRDHEHRASRTIDNLVRIGRQLTFLEARHELFETIQQPRGDRRVSGDDVDLLEEG